METGTSDIIIGVIALVMFLVFAFRAGRLLNNFKNKRFQRVWSPLVPIVSGTVINDNGGAASSYLAGTYQGLQIQSCIVPNRNRYRDESGYKYNYFDLSVREIHGKSDWNIEYRRPIFGFGSTGWQVRSDDKELEEKLRAAGVVEMVAPFGSPTITYRKKTRTLVYSDDITPRWAPEPAHFTRVLNLLVTFNKINNVQNSLTHSYPRSIDESYGTAT